MIITITIDEKELKNVVSRWWEDYYGEQSPRVDEVSPADIKNILGTENCKVNIRN